MIPASSAFAMFSRAFTIQSPMMFTAIVSLTMLIAHAQDTPSSESGPSDVTVDVESQIWPIFRSRCLNCHGPETADGTGPGGGFRIDTIDGILAGGHTGVSIVGESGELMRRLVSTDANYRMPKDEIPLSSSQIELIGNWIHAGTPWPNGGVITFPESSNRNRHPPGAPRNQSIGEHALNTLEDVHQKVRVILIPMTVFLAVMLLLERRKKVLKASNGTATLADTKLNSFDRLACTATSTHYLSVYLVIVLAGFTLYHFRRVAELERKIESVRENTRSNTYDSSRRNGIARDSESDSSPRIYRPQHPPRLGGVYYRGNDERNEKLFNGGYYRTATMRLSLRDHDNRVIQWGDKLDTSQCVVRLEIEKAPFTTSELFNERIFQGCYLSSSSPDSVTAEPAEAPIYLSPTESPDQWAASIKLTSRSAANHLSGRIYLYNQGAAHFGIQYDLHFEDGAVTDASELWMGAILLPGNSLVPNDNEIPLSQWFDFLPIPEITEPNTDDPTLLGIPEHTRK